ncbi:Uncharacterized protein QTN25_009614 [Entamoeba marina]
MESNSEHSNTIVESPQLNDVVKDTNDNVLVENTDDSDEPQTDDIEAIESNEVVTTEVKEQIMSYLNKPKAVILKIYIIIKEQIQRGIDLTCYIFTTSWQKTVIIANKPLIKKIYKGTSQVALLGVCVYAFGYVPYTYISQNQKRLMIH